MTAAWPSLARVVRRWALAWSARLNAYGAAERERNAACVLSVRHSSAGEKQQAAAWFLTSTEAQRRMDAVVAWTFADAVAAAEARAVRS